MKRSRLENILRDEDENQQQAGDQQKLPNSQISGGCPIRVGALKARFLRFWLT